MYCGCGCKFICEMVSRPLAVHYLFQCACTSLSKLKVPSNVFGWRASVFVGRRDSNLALTMAPRMTGRMKWLVSCIEWFDPYLEVWRQLITAGTPNPELAVHAAECASYWQQAYMYGGLMNKYNNNYEDNILSRLALDLKILTWSQLTPMRKAGYGIICFHHDRLAVIAW